MQLSDTPAKLVLPFANAGAKRSIPVASQVGITPGAASLTDGFPPLTRTPLSAGGVPPSGLDMNGVLYELSAILRWANAGGGYAYDATFATDTDVAGYPKGARILRSDGLGYWFNTVENNTTDPEAAGAAAAGWVPDFTNGVTAVTMTSANVTLTPLQYGKPTIVISGTLTANLNLIFPAIQGNWVVINNTTGAHTITCKTASGVGVLATKVRSISGDGVNIYSAEAVPNFGAVTMIRIGQNEFAAFNPDGTQIDISSSTTGGIQEAIDSACANGWDFHCYGGGVAGLAYPGTDVATIDCTTSIIFPPMQLKDIYFGAVTVNFSLGGSSTPGFVFDSCMMVNFNFEGQVVYSGNGIAVKFDPLNPVILDNSVNVIDSKFRIKTIAYIAGGSDGNSACVGFVGGAGVGPTVSCSFDFGEVNGANWLTGYAKYGIYADNDLLTKNIFNIARIHHVLDVGIQMGTSSSNSFGGNKWTVGTIQPMNAGSRAIDTFAIGDEYGYSADNAAGTLDQGVKLQPNTAGCIVVSRDVTGFTTSEINDLSTAGTNIVISSSGHVQTPQVKFPATQVASTDPNTLDDYEEGNWTPNLTFATPGDVAKAGVTAIGKYTKIGRMVVAQCVYIATVTQTTASGNLQITGLPFAVPNVASFGAYAACRWQGITKAGYTDITASANVNTTLCSFNASGSGVARAPVVAGDVPTGGVVDLEFTIIYFV